MGTVMIRVLVCGGRDYLDYERLSEALDVVHCHSTIDVLIEGGARGADVMASDWAQNSGVRNMTFPADWDRYGRSAGVMRNRQMLDEGKPDLVVAFPGGRGTANMVALAKQAGVEIMEIDR